MNILFVSGANSNTFGMPPLVLAQGESLKKYTCHNIYYFPLYGKGILGYLKNLPKLWKYLRIQPINIIHAHYSFSGIIASLSFSRKPVVVSLLGSDVMGNNFFNRLIIRYHKLLRWDAIIVKSREMQDKLKGKHSEVIPNGVDLSFFQPMDAQKCRNNLRWSEEKIHILFAANPERPEKNFRLAKEAVSLLSENQNSVEVHFLENIEHQEIPIWINAAHVVILTSLWEGSPNVIKEAMACNRPIVTTDVGDVKWLFGDEPGHFISTQNPENYSDNLRKAIEFSKRIHLTRGRDRIIALQIDSKHIAEKINDVYEKLFV